MKFKTEEINICSLFFDERPVDLETSGSGLLAGRSLVLRSPAWSLTRVSDSRDLCSESIGLHD